MSASSQLYYVLNDEKQAVKATMEEWAKFYEVPNNRIIKRTQLLDQRVRISTVFLGIDHGFGEAIPVLFETMIFVDGEEDQQWRYTTWVEAISHHNQLLSKWARTVNQHDAAIADLIDQSVGIDPPKE